MLWLASFFRRSDSRELTRPGHRVAGRKPDRFEAARGKADIKWRTDDLMAWQAHVLPHSAGRHPR